MGGAGRICRGGATEEVEVGPAPPRRASARARLRLATQRPRLLYLDPPESCVAVVLLYLDPPEICHVARLNRAFHGAASTDCVWAAKPPANYRYLAALAAASDDDCGCDDTSGGNGRCCASAAIKKEIYARLCQPTAFDGGTKEFWIQKNNGGLCLSISSKAMVITGIYDRRYWSHLPTEESRFHSVAYLQQIWWLEVDGEIDFCFPAGSYRLFFRLHLGHQTNTVPALNFR